MQEISQKWTIVSFIEGVPLEFEFDQNSWPLHVTISGTSFELDESIEKLTGKLRKSLYGQKSFLIKTTTNGQLGPSEKPVQVVFIKKSVELMGLHDQVLSALQIQHAVLTRPAHTVSGFVPHCTNQKSGKLEENSEYKITELSIVDMFSGSEHHRRKVVQKIILH